MFKITVVIVALGLCFFPCSSGFLGHNLFALKQALFAARLPNQQFTLFSAFANRNPNFGNLITSRPVAVTVRPATVPATAVTTRPVATIVTTRRPVTQTLPGNLGALTQFQMSNLGALIAAQLFGNSVISGISQANVAGGGSLLFPGGTGVVGGAVGVQQQLRPTAVQVG